MPCKVREVRILLILSEPLLSFSLAHMEAIENAKILPRDISIGNVIISHRGGVLIDGDLAKDIKDLDKIARQSFRTVILTVNESRRLSRRASDVLAGDLAVYCVQAVTSQGISSTHSG